MTTTTQLLEDVHGYGAARRVRFTARARARVSQLGLTADDVRYGLMQATALEREDTRFDVETTSRDGARLSLGLLFSDAYLLVTEVNL